PHPHLPLFFFFILRRPPPPPLFPYTTLFRSDPVLPERLRDLAALWDAVDAPLLAETPALRSPAGLLLDAATALERHSALGRALRSEEHTSELQSRFDLVCRLLLEKKNKHTEL